MRYFAYGSNLEAADLAAYCSLHGHAPLSLQGQPAYLPDYRPVFHYYSRGRCGGALDVVPHLGHACAGAVFELNDAQVAVLDAKESAGVNYERREVIVCADGDLARAFTYCVREGQRGDFVRPRDEYLRIVEKGYSAFKHSPDNLRRAAQNERVSPVRRLFVYGTLMRGECRAHFLVGSKVKEARLGGVKLLDLPGGYPGMVRSEPTDVVFGELHEVRQENLDSLLPALDEVEDFIGYTDLLEGHPRSMYERSLITLGGELAWTYFLRPGHAGPRILSGDWRRRN